MEKEKFVLTKRIYFVVFFLLIFTILLSSVKTTLDSFYTYYKYEKNNQAVHWINALYNSKPTRILSSYTGLETGYGFFGTNVASDFVITYDLLDKDGKKRITEKFVLRTKEASVRFTSLNRLFLDKLTKEPDQMFTRYIDIIMTDISKYIYKQNKGKYGVHLKVYLYHYPSLKQFQEGKNTTTLFLTDEIYYPSNE